MGKIVEKWSSDLYPPGPEPFEHLNIMDAPAPPILH